MFLLIVNVPLNLDKSTKNFVAHEHLLFFWEIYRTANSYFKHSPFCTHTHTQKTTFLITFFFVCGSFSVLSSPTRYECKKHGFKSFYAGSLRVFYYGKFRVIDLVASSTIVIIKRIEAAYNSSCFSCLCEQLIAFVQFLFVLLFLMLFLVF